MNLGLGNLTELKTQLLAEALRAGTRYDAAITAIGKGVAAQIENYCNRKFGRVENDTYIVSADRTHIYLPRYPFESISQVEFKSDEVAGWVVQTGNTIVTQNVESGLVFLGAALGPYWSHLRFTYTGGYWFDETEENNDTLPSGATQVPADLKLAWILHCKTVWQAIDKLGVDITKTGSSNNAVSGSLAALELSPAVTGMLGKFIRYAIT